MHGIVYNKDSTVHHCPMDEKVYTTGDRQALIIEFLFLQIYAKRNQSYFSEIAHKKIECLQAFLLHYLCRYTKQRNILLLVLFCFVAGLIE